MREGTLSIRFQMFRNYLALGVAVCVCLSILYAAVAQF